MSRIDRLSRRRADMRSGGGTTLNVRASHQEAPHPNSSPVKARREEIES